MKIAENDYASLIRRVLGNVVSGLAKSHESPASSQTHFDSAVCDLARATSWRPADPELLRIIEDAIEVTSKVRK